MSRDEGESDEPRADPDAAPGTGDAGEDAAARAAVLRALKAARSEPAVDRELAELPKPRRPWRTLSLAALALVVVGTAFTAWSLRGEAFYSLRPNAPLDLGELGAGTLTEDFSEHYVRGHAGIDLRRALSYRRPGEADRFRLAPLTDVADLWVELRVPEQYDTPRYLPPESLSGRLVPASALGLRYRGLASRLPANAWVLVDGLDPASARWVFLLFLLAVGFGVWALASAVRILRRLPAN